MQMKDKYRTIIIVSYILLIICSILLFITVHNHIRMNPDIRMGNVLYFLILIIILLGTVIFALHLLEEQRSHELEEKIIESPVVTEPTSKEPTLESYLSPYEVDIDLIAENIQVVQIRQPQ